MSYLVDTNVFSEQLKPRPEQSVLDWLIENEVNLFISVITIAEIRRGLERLPEGRRKAQFQLWLSSINRTMSTSVLGVNRSVAHTWGQMQGQLDKKGICLSPSDGLIAATAIQKGLTVVTRNEKDFKLSGVKVLNPFRNNST